MFKTFGNSLISYTISISGFIRRFKNDEMHGNFFKLLGSDETSILVGARNVVYNITLPSLKENINQVIINVASMVNFFCTLIDEYEYVIETIFLDMRIVF